MKRFSDYLQAPQDPPGVYDTSWELEIENAEEEFDKSCQAISEYPIFFEDLSEDTLQEILKVAKELFPNVTTFSIAPQDSLEIPVAALFSPEGERATEVIGSWIEAVGLGDIPVTKEAGHIFLKMKMNDWAKENENNPPEIGMDYEDSPAYWDRDYE